MQVSSEDVFEETEGWEPGQASIVGLTLNAGQQNAFDLIEAWLQQPKHRQMWMALTGPAGTGKTRLLQCIAGLLARPIFTAMTGKAATRMHEAAKVPANTLHKMLYGPPRVDEDDGSIHFDAIREPPYESILVIDEASMVTPSIAKHLKRWTNEFAVRVLFIGDGFQLPPVLGKNEGEDEDYSIFSEVAGPSLTQVMRNGDAILDAATMLRTKNVLPRQSRGGYEFRVEDDAIEHAIRAYLDDPDDHALITWTNRTRMLTNQIIRSRRGIVGERPQPGEPILICKNGGRDILNGEVYTVADIQPDEMIGPVPTYRIRTTCEKVILTHGYSWTGEPPYIQDRDEWKEYRRAIDRRTREWVWRREEGQFDADPPEPIPVTYGYALTAHKAQGSEYRRATVYMPAMDGASSHFRKLTTLPDGTKMPFGIRYYYTCVTRAKSRLAVVVGRK